MQSWTGSLSLAGSITALFTLGNAIGLTLQGVLIDRLGDRAVLLTGGLVSGLALGTVALAGGGLRPSLLGGLVLLAGLSVPAITTAVRRSLPLLTDDPTIRSAGYAALSVMFQLAFAIGPLLVTLAVVATGRPSDALLLAAAMIVTATAIFGFGAPAQRQAQPESNVTRSGLTTVRPLLALYGVAALTGVATGMTTVAVPAVTQAAGLVAVAGVAFAASAVGDVTGAVIFGSRSWPLTERQQLGVALLAAGCVAGVVYLSSDTLWSLVLAIGIGGALGAPVGIRLSSLLDDLARPEALGRAYAAWAASASSPPLRARAWPGTSAGGWNHDFSSSAHRYSSWSPQHFSGSRVGRPPARRGIADRGTRQLLVPRRQRHLGWPRGFHTRSPTSCRRSRRRTRTTSPRSCSALDVGSNDCGPGTLR